MKVISFVLLVCMVAACSSRGSESAHLGEISLEVSGDPEAIPAFKEGLLLLHSFQYTDAAEHFREAQEIDSTFALAFWGEAMSENHPLWNSQDREQAMEILKRLAASEEERLAMAKLPLEKDLMHAAHILYGEGEKFERDSLYSLYMKELHEKYPKNHEVAAFYALSLLGARSDTRSVTLYEQGAHVAQEILKENPQHPGALHYLIHSYDDPDHAHLALHAANNYAQVAPDATHALHMPSHIYVALGMWDEVVASNEASYQSSVNRMQEKSLDNDGRSYHALEWLLYGYLQQKRFDIAQTIIENMIGYVEETPSANARSYLIYMIGEYAVATRQLSNEVMLHPIRIDDLNLSIQAAYAFNQGAHFFAKNNPERLQGVITDLDTAIQAVSAELATRGIAFCNAAGYATQPANAADVQWAKAIQAQLKAFHSELIGDREATEIYMREAVRLETENRYMFGPPLMVIPSQELYGEWLLQQGRYEEALPVLEAALDRTPNRTITLEGLEKAAREAQRTRLADSLQNVINENLLFEESDFVLLQLMPSI